MAKVGIFFGSDTGKTRKVAKLIHESFASDEVAAPVNINKAGIEDLPEERFRYTLAGIRNVD